jgi:hypothetical protein
MTKTVHPLNARLEREVQRERHERELHDEMRVRLGTTDEVRNKDARGNVDAVNLKRPN